MIFSANSPTFASFVKGTAGTLLIKCTNLVIGFLFYLLLAKILSTSEFGQYSLVTSLGLIIAIAIRFGMDKLVIRYTAEFRAQPSYALLKGILIWSFCLTLILGSLATLTTVLAVGIFPTLTNIYYYAIPVFIGVAFTVLCQGFFRANQQHFLALAPDQIGRQGLAIIIVTLFYLYESSISSTDVLFIHAAASIVVALCTIFLLVKSIDKNITTAKAQYQTNRWFKSGLPVLWSNIMVMGELQAVILLSGWLMTLNNVGIISLVIRLSAIASLTLVAVNLYIAPTLARLHINNNNKALQKALHRSARLASTTMAPIAVLTIYFGREILSMFGPDYVQGYMALVIFIASRGISSMFGSVGTLLTQTGFEKEVALIFTCSVALMILSSMLLTPYLGLAGVATGVLLSTIIRSLANWYVAYKNLKVSSFIV